MKRAIKHGRLDVHQANAVACVWEDSGRVIVETMLPIEAEPLGEFFRRMLRTSQAACFSRTSAGGPASCKGLWESRSSVWMSFTSRRSGGRARWVALIDGQSLEQLLFHTTSRSQSSPHYRKETRPGLYRGAIQPSYLEACATATIPKTREHRIQVLAACGYRLGIVSGPKGRQEPTTKPTNSDIQSPAADARKPWPARHLVELRR